MNVIQKIIECRKMIDKTVKDANGYGYTYVSGSQLLEKIRPKMDELGLFLQVETFNVEWSTHDYKNSKDELKTDFIVTGDIGYTWINAEEPNDKLECNFSLLGQQDDISKAFGSGLTYSERYFILKLLQAPTDNDDPDKKDTTNKFSYGNRAPRQSQQVGGAIGKCVECGTSINAAVTTFSNKKFGKPLCIDCQKKQA
ncbi:ERF family protein [Clostridium massiliamazoniense]|uniref:ERF family protein n=1 Tax=Clostridium massiliamazoniense TaxID=1347366 RepID=UPI0006D7ED75|nr:ERF family protein [Clostridium massiliamazoniense]